MSAMRRTRRTRTRGGCMAASGCMAKRLGPKPPACWQVRGGCGMQLPYAVRRVQTTLMYAGPLKIPTVNRVRFT